MEKKIVTKHNFAVNNSQHAILFQNRDREQIKTPYIFSAFLIPHPPTSKTLAFWKMEHSID